MSRDLNEKLDGMKYSSSSSSSCRPKAFLSQPNLSPKMKPTIYNNSWEHLPKPNWIVTHNGRILMELNYKNSNRAKLPIAEKTAKLLQKCSENDVITTTLKHVRFNQQQQQQQQPPHDENQNLIRNDDRDR